MIFVSFAFHASKINLLLIVGVESSSLSDDGVSGLLLVKGDILLIIFFYRKKNLEKKDFVLCRANEGTEYILNRIGLSLARSTTQSGIFTLFEGSANLPGQKIAKRYKFLANIAGGQRERERDKETKRERERERQREREREIESE